MKNILLLEDEETLNRSISFLLGKENYNVHSSFNIKEANEVFIKIK